MPILIIVYGEFTTLLVDRTMGTETNPTIFLQWFGGGRCLLVNPHFLKKKFKKS